MVPWAKAYRGTGFGHVKLLHSMAHAGHVLSSAAALLKQKLINMHVIFDLLIYCCVLLTEVRSGCKSREHMPSDTQTGCKQAWLVLSSRVETVHDPVHNPQSNFTLTLLIRYFHDDFLCQWACSSWKHSKMNGTLFYHNYCVSMLSLRIESTDSTILHRWIIHPWYNKLSGYLYHSLHIHECLSPDSAFDLYGCCGTNAYKKPWLSEVQWRKNERIE